MLRLKYTPSDGTERVHDFDTLPAVLGRHPRADLVIDNPGVSREHARLFQRGEAVLLADLNSSNGTFLNGKKVSRAELKAGDEIRLGRALLIVESCGAGRQAPPVVEPPRPATAEPIASEPIASEPSGPEIFDIDDGGDGSSGVDTLPAAKPAGAEAAAGRARPPHPARPAPDAQQTVRRTEGVKVKDGLLQYHKISSHKKAGLLRSEFVQHHPLFRVVAIVVMLAVAAGCFLLFKWLTETTVPATWEENPESIETGIDEEF